MSGEMKEATKWSFWCIGIMIIAVLVFGGIGLIKKPLSARIDREVAVNSHQYKEGMAERTAVLSANIAEINIMLAENPDEETKKALKSQRSVLSVQLKAARR